MKNWMNIIYKDSLSGTNKAIPKNTKNTTLCIIQNMDFMFKNPYIVEIIILINSVTLNKCF